MKFTNSKIDGAKALTIESFESLPNLDEYLDIEILSLHHFPKALNLDLGPLSRLTQLKTIYLSTTPGWDGSSKTLSVESFKPLANLKLLENFRLTGVVPNQHRIAPLTKIKTLQKIDLWGRFYQLEDFAELRAALPNAKGLDPIVQLSSRSKCDKCNQFPLLLLRGTKPHQRSFVCPQCNNKAIRRHLIRWQECGGKPDYQYLSDGQSKTLVETFGLSQSYSKNKKNS